jgi:Ca2+-binding EF-hand superfamily protein
MDMLQNSVLKFYAHNLIEKEDLKKIRRMFEDIDENGDGLLSYEEIQSIMKSMGKEETTKEVFDILDYQKTKNISYQEFIKTLMDREQLKVEKNIKRCFDAIDTDKNGRLSINELRKISAVHSQTGGEKQFKEHFYKYSNGKHYVSLIS